MSRPDGGEMSRDDVMDYIRDQKQGMQRRTFVEQVQAIANVDKASFRSLLTSIATQISVGKKVTPKQMTTVVWRASENDMPLDTVAASIQIARDDHRRQMFSMPKWKYEQIRPYLSSTQKSTWDERKNYDPPSTPDDDVDDIEIPRHANGKIDWDQFIDDV